MTTFVQLHLLTAYPPANLNRDDTGRPKTCVFGGAPRLRISSQSLKRAWRTSEVFEEKFDNTLAKRTQGAGRLVCDKLLAGGVDEARAISIARSVARIAGKPTTNPKLDQTFTGQLVFLSPAEIEQFKAFADQVLNDPKLANELAASAGEDEESEIDGDNDEETQPKAKGKSKKKGLSKKRIAELRNQLLIEIPATADMGMFGRMLADSPKFNVEAAVQVAHALSTHKVVVEDDYYVAVEELKEIVQREDAGTSFIGVQEFAAGLFYLYACVDTDLLKRNLKGDASLAADAVEALLRSAATVSPRGKQASFASRARASFVMVERGSQQPRSLAAAFLKPVTASEGEGDLAAASIDRLAAFRDALDQAYGANADGRAEMTALPGRVSGSLDVLVAFCREATA